MSEHESAAMWSLYCPDSPGIAVRSTFVRMCRSLRAAQPNVFIGKVTYLNYETETIPDGHLLAPFLYRRMSFEHEHEVRAVVRKMPDPTMPERESPYLRVGGLDLSVILDELVESIFVSPTAPPWYSDLVRRVAAKYEVSASVHQSSLDADPIY